MALNPTVTFNSCRHGVSSSDLPELVKRGRGISPTFQKVGRLRAARRER